MANSSEAKWDLSNTTPLYVGKATVKNYGASSKAKPYIGLYRLDEEQLEVFRKIETNSSVTCIWMKDGTNVLYMDMQFAEWSYTSATKRIKLTYDEVENSKAKDTIEAMLNNEFDFIMYEGQATEKIDEEKGPHGEFAKKFVLSRLMVDRRFWELVGPEEKYLAWLRLKPCLVTKAGVRNTQTGDDKCEAAHVRDIKHGAGIGTKPEYLAIPLHPKIHAQQHSEGETFLWEKAKRPTPSNVKYPIYNKGDHVRKWLESSALKYISQWIQHEIKAFFGVKHLCKVSQEMLHEFMIVKGGESIAAELIPYSEGILLQ